MGEIAVLLELEPATEVVDADVGEADIGARVRAVHAAPVTATDPSAHTLCGQPVDELEPEPYTPAGAGAPWYPPEYHSRRCLDCEAALSGG